MKYPRPVGLINYSTARSMQSYDFKDVTQFDHANWQHLCGQNPTILKVNVLVYSIKRSS